MNTLADALTAIERAIAQEAFQRELSQAQLACHLGIQRWMLLVHP